MRPSDLLADGATAWRVLAASERGLAAIATRPRAAVALSIATAASLAAAAVVLPRVDYGTVPPPAEAPADGQVPQEPTGHEHEETAVRDRKLGQLAGWTSAVLSPSALALLAAGLLFVGFRVAGTRPAFRSTLSVAAHGTLPVWLEALLRIPAAVVHAPVPNAEVPLLLPASLAALLPRGAPAPWVAFLSGFDLFSLWAVALVALGMAHVSGASRARSAATTAVLFLACVALFWVVPAGARLSAGSAAGPR